MPIRTVRCDLPVLRAVAAHVCGVVRIKIQKHPAGLQNTKPFPVGLFRLRQRPGEISAEHHVEAFVRIIKRLRVHLAEHNGKAALRSDLPCLAQHGRRQVNALHPLPGL